MKSFILILFLTVKYKDGDSQFWKNYKEKLDFNMEQAFFTLNWWHFTVLLLYNFLCS